MSTWRERNLDRARQLNRESARRVAARKKKDMERRRRAVERAKAWNDAHPEQRRAQLQRWRDANREKVRQQSRDSYARNREAVAERAKAARDRDPDKYKARTQAWRKNNPGYSTEYGRQYRQDPERYARMLQLNREAKQLKRRLAQLELPPRSIHRTTAAERRANIRDADVFFTSRDRGEWFRQYQVLHESIDEVMTHQGASLRALASAHARVRAAQGMPAVDIVDDIYARAVTVVLDRGSDFDRLTSADVARAVRSVQETHARREHELQAATLHSELTTHVRRNPARLTEEAQLENRALVHAGKQPRQLDVLAHAIAFEEIKGRVNLSSITPAEAAKIVNAVRESHLGLFELPQTRNPLASPARVPGVGATTSQTAAPATPAPGVER